MMNILTNIAEATYGSIVTPGESGGGSVRATDAYSLITIIVEDILDPVIGVLIAVAVVLFLYGVIKYIVSGDDETKRKEAKNYIIYGIVGLFVMVSVWGLVGILTGTFGTDVSAPTNKLDLLPKK